jgi:hyaluronan synthase
MMYWTLYLLFGATIRQQFVAIAVTLVLGVVKSIYGVICTRDWRYIYFYLYTYVYFLVIIPSKLTAYVTLWDVSWGTRGSVSSQIITDIKNYTMPLVWYGAMGAGFLYNLIRNLSFDWDDKIFRSAFVGVLSHTTFIGVSVIIYGLVQYLGLLRTPVMDDLENKKKTTQNENNTIEVV